MPEQYRHPEEIEQLEIQRLKTTNDLIEGGAKGVQNKRGRKGFGERLKITGRQLEAARAEMTSSLEHRRQVDQINNTPEVVTGIKHVGQAMQRGQKGEQIVDDDPAETEREIMSLERETEKLLEEIENYLESDQTEIKKNSEQAFSQEQFTECEMALEFLRRGNREAEIGNDLYLSALRYAHRELKRIKSELLKKSDN